ncbi:MAG: hypothetical protein QOE75_811 [Solirubrobacterales bacterium]|nr:hypothetical protein [Solirubrobacterales bacterium]
MTGDIYISADIEADGPIPGVNSMLAFGLAVAGRFDGRQFSVADPAADTFYCELSPISDQVDPKALEISGLDRERLVLEGADPAEAMRDAAAWVVEQSGSARPVLVGYPVVFDWMFLHWYFVCFAGESPFGFSSALDIKTMYQQKAGVTLSEAGRGDLPDFLRSDREHTHQALDDAIEQADVFARVFSWDGNAAR